jgi:plasmid stabilization system protein ParE
VTVATLIVRPSAQVDIDEALSWYHQRDPNVAQRLFLEFDVVFDRIRKNPAQFPIVAEPVQRALLRRFPYSVYFIVGGDLAAVVAVLHQRRKPISWRTRDGAG